MATSRRPALLRGAQVPASASGALPLPFLMINEYQIRGSCNPLSMNGIEPVISILTRMTDRGVPGKPILLS